MSTQVREKVYGRKKRGFANAKNKRRLPNGTLLRDSLIRDNASQCDPGLDQEFFPTTAMRLPAALLTITALFKPLPLGMATPLLSPLPLGIPTPFWSPLAFLTDSDLPSPSCVVGALATLAFLVVLRVLIKLFFSMDMVSCRS
jgi:hypothetical protein